MKYSIYVLLSAGVLFLASASAYEPKTHQQLSDAALVSSVLVKSPCGTCSTVLDNLGLDAYNVQIFPDSQKNQTVSLGPDGDGEFKANPSGTIEYLITTGAALEDAGRRSECHFDDPIEDHFHPLHFESLGGKEIKAPYDASQWATGYRDGGVTPIASECGGEIQIFSLRNAQDYFYKALTEARTDDRNLDFGNLFLSLGHSMHLLEDMAQPQHVRNDLHCDDPLVCPIIASYQPSAYERYVYSHPGKFGNYGLPSFDDAKSYWSNTLTGLADFTNYNFPSIGTLGSIIGWGSDYIRPQWNGTTSEKDVTDVLKEINQPESDAIAEYCVQPDSSCQMTFYATTVFDEYTETQQINARAVSKSIFDADLKERNQHQIYTLNSANYAAARDLLTNRAVGYAAGLINYFFRGRLDVQSDPNTPGGYLVINKSKDVGMTDGTLGVYYDDINGERHLLLSKTDVSMLHPGDTYPIQITAPTDSDPAPKTPGQYMLVFKGKIGSEEGVAGKQFKVESNEVYLSVGPYDSCLQYDTCFSSISQYDEKFDLKKSFGALNDIYGLAVYNGNRYTIEEHDSYVPSEQCNYMVMKNGTQFVSTPIPFESYCPDITDSQIHTYNALGVNSSRLYVFKSNYSHIKSQNTGYIEHYLNDTADIFDLDGNLTSHTANLPVEGVYQASVNNTTMCLSGWKDDYLNQTTVLTDLNGNKIAELPVDVYYGAYCALTNDRIYVLNFPDGDPVLQEYDLETRRLLNSSAVSEPAVPGYYPVFFAVVATDSKIYIPLMVDNYSKYYFSHKFIVYDRIVNKDGTETLQREPDVTLPNYQTQNSYSYLVFPALDMKDVLGTPGK